MFRYLYLAVAALAIAVAALIAISIGGIAVVSMAAFLLALVLYLEHRDRRGVQIEQPAGQRRVGVKG
jgi:hypothetical protein